MGMAFLQAFREVRGAQALRNVYTIVNARKFMPLLRPDAMFGVVPGVKLSMRGLPLPQKKSTRGFWTCTQAIKGDLTRQVDVSRYFTVSHIPCDGAYFFSKIEI